MSNVAKRLSKGDASKEEIDLQFDVASGRFDQILRRIAVLDNRSAAN